MKTVVLATTNQGKVKEFQDMLRPLGYEVKSLKDYPEVPEIVETGQTFTENATIKASTTAQIIRHPTMADDSGLVVDALDGRPGIYSARYAGEGHDDALNRQKVLEEMRNVPDSRRQAHFVCALVVCDALGNVEASYIGQMDGWITHEEEGDNGFGYDPIFYVSEYGQTTAEISETEKNKISHRGKALRALASDLKEGKLEL